MPGGPGAASALKMAYAAAGLPDGFHRAAAVVYGRLEGFKGATGLEVADALAVILEES